MSRTRRWLAFTELPEFNVAVCLVSASRLRLGHPLQLRADSVSMLGVAVLSSNDSFICVPGQTPCPSHASLNSPRRRRSNRRAMPRRMNNTALNALAGMARIVMLLLLLGPWANAAHASMRPDCPMRANASSAPCPSLDTRAAGHLGCMQASMNAAAPCLTPAQRAPAKEQLPSAALAGWFVPTAQIATLARPPKAIDAAAPTIRSRRRNASLAVLHCSFQR